MNNLLFKHARLNTATHDALHEMFGVVNAETFEHLAELIRQQQLVDAEGKDVYLPNVANLNTPILLLSGKGNITCKAIAIKTTYEWLCKDNGASYCDLVEMPGYGHIDCLFGKDAAEDVFPHWPNHFEKTVNDR